jgi:hypothetical protein
LSYVPSKLASNAERLGSPRAQGHEPQGDRTGEFVVITDCPVENSEGNRPTLPLRFGGDQQTVVGGIEFASFAMLAMPGHEAVPRLLPDKEMSPIFASDRLAAGNSSPGVIFENIFLLLSGPRLTSNSRARNLTK